ncbi:MAG: bifunctional riboflavin kinase/FAD synthetase [Ktedonobacterales bacterium]
MRVNYLSGTVPPLGPAVLTVGFFDGVHLGHRKLIARTAELAGEHSAQAVAVTFWPSPASVVHPDIPVQLLSTFEEKLALLDGLGQLDALLVVPFGQETSKESPEVFLDQIAGVCQPLALVEGTDFALGYRRVGDVTYLRALGEERGFAVESYEVQAGGERVSSTRIRKLVESGTLTAATLLLGREYTLLGEVVAGEQRGRLLGFPTANLCYDARKILPANGVYAVRVRLPGEADVRHQAVCNIGVRPTFAGQSRLVVEVYLLDSGMDLYGLHLEVAFVARLREERRFSGVDELRAQIATDVERSRELLSAGGGPKA